MQRQDHHKLKQSAPSGNEMPLHDNEFIVSKADIHGNITYCNQLFIKLSGYSEAELLGRPHNLLRHSDMLRTLFKLMWDSILSGQEFVGYFKNLRKDGDRYWVIATIAPVYFDDPSQISGFFSTRRKASHQKAKTIQEIYREILIAEQEVNRKDAIEAGLNILNRFIESAARSNYFEFVLSL